MSFIHLVIRIYTQIFECSIEAETKIEGMSEVPLALWECFNVVCNFTILAYFLERFTANFVCS